MFGFVHHRLHTTPILHHQELSMLSQLLLWNQHDLNTENKAKILYQINWPITLCFSVHSRFAYQIKASVLMPLSPHPPKISWFANIFKKNHYIVPLWEMWLLNLKSVNFILNYNVYEFNTQSTILISEIPNYIHYFNMPTFKCYL